MVEKTRHAAYISSMSRTRFYNLLEIIRFDDKTTREERRENDKFTALREVFEVVDDTFPSYYNSGNNVVINKMLHLFRGSCSFKVFIKNKPGKCGILIRILADCSDRYVYNM